MYTYVVFINFIIYMITFASVARLFQHFILQLYMYKSCKF